MWYIIGVIILATIMASFAVAHYIVEVMRSDEDGLEDILIEDEEVQISRIPKDYKANTIETLYPTFDAYTIKGSEFIDNTSNRDSNKNNSL